MILQTKHGKEGNCLQACLASIYNIPIDSIPMFQDMPGVWLEELNAWSSSKLGVTFISVRVAKGDIKFLYGATLICSILSSNPEVERHAIITYNGGGIFDPSIGLVCRDLTEDDDPVFLVPMKFRMPFKL